MDNYESVTFVNEDGEETEFYILEETTLNGCQYLLVQDGDDNPDDDEVTAYIMKGTFTSSDGGEEMISYEMLEDEEELISVSKVFEQLMEDTDFEVEE